MSVRSTSARRRALAAGIGAALLAATAAACVRSPAASRTASAAPGTSPATVATPSPFATLFEQVRGELSGDRARATVAFVEQRWRLPGNRGFDESIRHVEAGLRQAGFVAEEGAPAGARLVYRVERRPMARDTWEPDDAALTIVGHDTATLRWRTNRNMLAIHSFSTPAGGIEAEVVNVGRGRPEDFAEVDVAGKIVLADAPVGRLFGEAVQKRGAVGVLAYSMPAYLQPERHTTSIQFGSIPQDTARRAWGLLLSHDARGALHRALAAGPVRVRVETRSRTWRSEELTVVAEVRGGRAPEERFVFSAHVQEPGANDNASGVGAQLEMARTLAALVQRGAADPARTVTFLWGDEIKSTRDFLAADSGRTRGVRWGMSLDMVGEDTERTGGTFLIEKMPDPSAVWTRGEDRHSEWGGQPLPVERIVPHYLNDYTEARAREQAAVTGWVVNTNPYEGGSDHIPFLQAGKPAVLFWHFTDVFYHTDNDRLEHVSARTLANVGTTALVSALGLTAGDAGTVRAIVDDVERAAMRRLAAEEALSRAAVQGAGAKADSVRAAELVILRTWARYYADALRTVGEVELGGPSAATTHRISEAVARVAARGTAAEGALR